LPIPEERPPTDAITIAGTAVGIAMAARFGMLRLQHRRNGCPVMSGFPTAPQPAPPELHRYAAVRRAMEDISIAMATASVANDLPGLGP
jgi:hypothetical protein|tara:strand:- start:47839 stop:48105 length:267 start_codon:yes stop_codon:yes gene_type:complete